MTSTVLSPSRKTPGRTAILIGVDQRGLERVRTGDHQRVVAYAFPGQPDVPGHETLRCDTPLAMSQAMEKSFRSDKQISELGTADIIDCAGHDEERHELTMLLMRCMGIFGNDVLDAIQAPLHLAQNAKVLMRAPEPSQINFGTTPTIAIGAGPSLSAHYEELRRLNGKVIVVCVDSILEVLKREGITVHFCTPLERILEVNKLFTQDHPDVTFMGCPIVHPGVVGRFGRHIYCPNPDVLYDWGCAGEDRYSAGIGTGSMCVMRAARMAHGPVYLVGHDLAFAAHRSHADGVNTVQCYEHRKDFFVPANAGGDVESCDFWDRLRRDHAMFLANRGNAFNVAAHDGVGAVIDNTEPGPLPDPDTLPDIGPIAMPSGPPGRYEKFRERCRRVPRDARVMIDRLAQAVTAQDLQTSSLCRTENSAMFSYVLRSAYAQIVFEGKMGRADITRDWFVEAATNVLMTYRECWDEIARA